MNNEYGKHKEEQILSVHYDLSLFIDRRDMSIIRRRLSVGKLLVFKLTMDNDSDISSRCMLVVLGVQASIC